MGAEAGDPRRQGDAAAPVLQGEGSGEEATAAFVGGGEEPVDGTVGLGGRAVRLLPASRALASMRERPLVHVGHTPFPPCEKISEREDILTQDQATYLRASAYMTSKGERLWVITEAADDSGCRAATTLLLASEY
jgi:hypothetical protein